MNLLSVHVCGDASKSRRASPLPHLRESPELARPLLPSAAPATSARTPSLRRRMGCFIYEGVLLFGVVFVSALLYSVLTNQRNAMQGREGLLAIALVLMPGLYLVWYWSQTGQTLPMQTWHIRLTSLGGHRVSRLRATLRYLASWVWFLPALALWHLAGWRTAGTLMATLAGGVVVYALLSLLHPQRQFWHDALCGTRLVDTRPGTTP